jgi:hypothetical protein
VQADGCPERLDVGFLRWIWRYPTVSRPRLDLALAQAGRNADVVELRTPADVDRYLASVRLCS